MCAYGGMCAWGFCAYVCVWGYVCVCVYGDMCVCIGYMGACGGFGLLFCAPAKAGTNYIKVTGNAPPPPFL